MKISKRFIGFGAVIAVLLIGIFTYGLITDCPDTAGYVDCSEVH
jgi:hypothetical protein